MLQCFSGLVLWCLLVCANASACHLRVIVKDYKDNPKEATVRILDQGQQLIHETGTKNGIAEICELAVETPEFSVLVGWDSCGQVQVRRLKHPWRNAPGEPFVVPVRYQNCHSSFTFPTTGCPIAVKVVDKDQKPIQGALVHLDDKKSNYPTNSHGLAFHYRFGARENAIGKIHVEYQNMTKDVDYDCTGERISVRLKVELP